MDMKSIRVISLGWGVQSFTLAAMAALGIIDPVIAAIHADTTHEREHTYIFAKKWKPWLENHGVKVITVQAPDTEPVDRFGGMMLPAYTETPKGKGQMSRQCTDNWKRAAIRRWLQVNRERRQVDQLLGISLDEFTRMRDSDVKYIVNCYPLIEKRMTRADCVAWLTKHDLEVPQKSSCVFCPFLSKNEWLGVKANQTDWEQAIKADNAIRKSRPPYDLFVHKSCIPLEELSLKTPEELGQVNIFDLPCDSGYCFI